MKKLFILVLFLFVSVPMVFAECTASDNKCSDLITNMYDRRAVLFNAMNLTDDQKVCRETIDKKYQDNSTEKFNRYEQEKFVLKNMQKHGASEQALNKQEKIVKSIEKELVKMNDDYDEELKSILNSAQKNKLHEIRKIEKRALKLCKKDKAFYKRDENLKPFGVK